LILWVTGQRREAEQRKVLLGHTVIVDELPRDEVLYILEEVDQDSFYRIYVILCLDTGERYALRQELDAPNLPTRFIVTGQTYNGQLRIIGLRDRP
jgi:hypothetical protein